MRVILIWFINNMTDLSLEDMKPGDRYEFVRVRGKGSYGLVGEYKDTKTGKHVAIKRMNEVVDKIDAKRLLRELRILRNFKHENILNLNYVICKPGKSFFDLYMVTDLWDIDLSKIIRKSRDELSDEHIQYIIYQIFKGTQFLHSASLLHRDLKPSNILANEYCDICLCDFGFAREVNNLDTDMTEYVITRYYRAPEVMLSSHKYNQAVDVWAIGCTLYELLVGEPLFQAKHYLELIKMIIEKLGFPTDAELTAIHNPQAVNFLNKLPKHPPRNISDGINYPNKLALDLLDKCMKFEPGKRITAEAALRHPYLTSYFEESDITKSIIEVDFSFEQNEHITEAEIKLMLLEEINVLNNSADEPTVDILKYKKSINMA